jgi:pimeloyl-ACP methyl ester carboxylesterase
MKGTIQIEVKMKTENNFNDNKKEDNKKRIKIFLSAFIFVLCLTLIIASLSSTLSITNYSSSFFVYAKEQGEMDNVNNNETISSDTIEYVHHKTLVNGILIHYVIGGKGDPIVLLHGWPQTWYEWRNIIHELIVNNYTVIAPDMRGFGDSEKPQTGYDKKTIAEDIYQLVKKLGYSKIYLVAHDMGGPVAYSYAVAHPEDVNKMVILDTLLPGFGLEEAGNFSPNGLWHLSFHAVRDLPEELIKGKEDIYLNWFYDYGTYNQSAITTEDREEYIKQYSKPGALRAGFEYYRAFFEDAEQNKEYANEKLEIPILTIGGEAGLGNFTTTSFQMVANNVTGITLLNTGHFIPEERPNFLIKQIIDFFK